MYIDSLYLSYQGELHPEINEQLIQLKRQAQSEKQNDQAKAQLKVGEHLFEVKDKGTYYILVPVSRDSKNRQQPSNLKLKEVGTELSKLNIEVIFLLTDDKARDIESGLRATLLHSFGSLVRNIYLSVNNKYVDVWIDHKKEPDQLELKNINNRVSRYLEEFDLGLRSLSKLNDVNLPSKLACLNAIRIKSPASISSVADYLTLKGFTIPSQDWLLRKLDLLRKSGKIIRLKNGGYVLTYASISALGSALGFGSPDIERMLALAKSG
jgi:hypothetical protein